MSYNYSAKSRLSHEWGVLNFLQEKGITGGRFKQNKILIEFLKNEGLKYEKPNKRYKGMYDAFNKNSTIVQENWNKFHIFIRNYKNIENGN